MNLATEAGKGNEVYIEENETLNKINCTKLGKMGIRTLIFSSTEHKMINLGGLIRWLKFWSIARAEC